MEVRLGPVREVLQEFPPLLLEVIAKGGKNGNTNCPIRNVAQ